MNFRILICDDQPDFKKALTAFLGERYFCQTVGSAEEARPVVDNFDLLLLDIEMENPDAGLDLLAEIKSANPEQVVILMSGRNDLASYRRAIRDGADDYLPKSAPPQEVIDSIERARAQQALKKENQFLRRRQSGSEANLVGQSAEIESLRKTISKVRTTPFNILITGETGVGKELVARSLRRENEPFVCVDSATLTDTMAESLLFGHEKGAFTGADKKTQGLFEQADGGSLYFDEVANMPLPIQTKLLRAIQEKEIRRLGSSEPFRVNVRVIAATNEPLDERVEKGLFKADLYQRLAVIPIEVPPLRDRTEDVLVLFDLFMNSYSAGKVFEVSDDVKKALSDYSWPGNVRELSNLAAYLVTLAESNRIEIDLLPQKVTSDSDAVPKISNSKVGLYDEILDYEGRLLRGYYRQFGSNLSQMARRLKMDRTHLYKKLKTHGIRSEERT